MRTELVILLVFGVLPAIMVNAQHDHREGQGGGQRQFTPHAGAPMNAPPMHSAPMNNAPPQANRPVIQHVAPMSRPNFQANRPIIHNVVPNQPNVPQYSRSNQRISGSTTHIQSQHTGNYNQQHWGHHHNYDHGHDHDHNSFYVIPYYYSSGYNYNYPYNYDNYYYDNSYYDYNSAPYTYSDEVISYPNSYYVCYQIDQSGENLYHISCPYPVSWYSTDPSYSSYDYQSNYQPQYVCPNHDAPYYLEFTSSYDATTWANNYCNLDIQGQDLPQQ